MTSVTIVAKKWLTEVGCDHRHMTIYDFHALQRTLDSKGFQFVPLEYWSFSGAPRQENAEADEWCREFVSEGDSLSVLDRRYFTHDSDLIAFKLRFL